MSNKPAWVASLRIDVDCANTHANHSSPTRAIVKRRTKRPSPLGKCRTPGCLLKAYHLGNCYREGGYLADFMRDLVLNDESKENDE